MSINYQGFEFDMQSGVLRIAQVSVDVPDRGPLGGQAQQCLNKEPTQPTQVEPPDEVIDLPVDPAAGDQHGTHNIEFVSRHSIAETGLICQRCRKQTTDRADYSQVATYRFPSGDTNEGVRCTNQRTLGDGTEVFCGCINLASPDTEHGDNISMDKGLLSHEESLRFRRITREQAVRDEFGSDVSEKGVDKIIPMHDGFEIPEAPNYQELMDPAPAPANKKKTAAKKKAAAKKTTTKKKG
jgi:hypothetical protein